LVAAIVPPEPSKDPHVEDIYQAPFKGPRETTHQSQAGPAD
jgi:hypothetical protein